MDAKALNLGVGEVNREIPSVMVMGEMAKPRDTFVLMRGDYRISADKVFPNTPAGAAAVAAGRSEEPADTGEMAGGSGEPAHCARRGQSFLADVFWPRHRQNLGRLRLARRSAQQPALAGLAGHRVRCSKWDVKKMQRLIVTSAAYRQSSTVTPELLEKDPENQPAGAWPAFPLPAEMIRDNALAVSGLINHARSAAPACFPISPRDCGRKWRLAATSRPRHTCKAMAAIFTAAACIPSGNVPFPIRRSALSMRPIVRNAPHGARITNTPLQALVLMNDPTYVEAARVFAERDIKEAGPNEDRSHSLCVPAGHRS